MLEMLLTTVTRKGAVVRSDGGTQKKISKRRASKWNGTRGGNTDGGGQTIMACSENQAILWGEREECGIRENWKRLHPYSAQSELGLMTRGEGEKGRECQKNAVLIYY